MAVELALYQSEHRPVNDTDPAGGGIGATPITDATIGEDLPNFSANPTGGAIRYQYVKECLFAESGSDTFHDGKFYFLNSVDDLAASRTLKFRIANATDATDTTIRVIGQTAAGAPQTEDISIAGVITAVAGSKVFKTGAGGLIQFFVLGTISGALKDLATVAVEIFDSIDTVLGEIPVGFHSAHANLYMFAEGSLNATTESANRLTAPAGATWTKPRTSGTGIAAAGDIDDGDYQGIWVRDIMYPGTTSIADGEKKIICYGSDV